MLEYLYYRNRTTGKKKVFMIKMHCDRCDRSQPVHWTKGAEKGDPVTPEGWGEVRAPDSPASLAIYVLCDACLAELHIWVKNDPDQEDDEVEDLIEKYATQ